MLPYSALKNKAKVIELYSMLYPATISASASGLSNGVRFVSASDAIKKIAAKGMHGITYQSDCCCRIKSPRLADPLSTINVNKTKEKNTSYEIICADERSDPKNAYLLLLDQPDKIIA